MLLKRDNNKNNNTIIIEIEMHSVFNQRMLLCSINKFKKNYNITEIKNQIKKKKSKATTHTHSQNKTLSRTQHAYLTFIHVNKTNK